MSTPCSRYHKYGYCNRAWRPCSLAIEEKLDWSESGDPEEIARVNRVLLRIRRRTMRSMRPDFMEPIVLFEDDDDSKE